MPRRSSRETPPSKDAALDLALAPEPKSFLPPAVVFESHIRWVDGIPQLSGVPVRISHDPQNALQELMRKSLDLPYDGKDPSLQGLSMGEAMVVQRVRAAAQGDAGAFESLMNRVVGEPVKKTQNLNVNASITDLLDQVARETRTVTIDVRKESPRQNVDDL